MAEAAPTTTRPARKTATPRKAAVGVAKAAAAPVAKAEPAKTDVDRFRVELEHMGNTARYSKFGAPDNMKGIVVGQLYAPLGTERVIVAVFGAGGSEEE